MSQRTTRADPVPGRLAAPVRRLSRYDLVLAVIPAAFLLAALLGTAGAVPAPAAVTAASLVGVLAMVDALFLNPPDRPAGGQGRA